MAFFTQPATFTGELGAIGTTKLFPLGTVVTDQFGNDYVYVKAGATTLAAGKFATYLTTQTNEQTVTVAHGIGTQTVHITAASITAGDFEDGYLIVTAGTALGECYQIKNNTTTDDPSSGLIAVELYQPLKTAWSTSDTDVSLFASPYKGLVVNPEDAQQKPCCIPQWPLTALYYGWALKSGYGALNIEVLAAGGAELDEKLIIASTTDTTNCGRGSLTGSCTTTGYFSATSGGTTDDALVYMAAAYIGRPVLGYVVMEEDCTNDEATLVRVDL